MRLLGELGCLGVHGVGLEVEGTLGLGFRGLGFQGPPGYDAMAGPGLCKCTMLNSPALRHTWEDTARFPPQT